MMNRRLPDSKQNGGFRLNLGEGDTVTDNASSSVGRSKLKRVGDGEIGGGAATGGFSLNDDDSGKRGGGMVSRYGATPSSGGSVSSSSGIPSSASKRSTSLPRHKQAAPSRLATSKGSALPMASRMKRSGSGMGAAGALDEDAFVNAFEDVPKVNVYSPKELLTHIQQIRDTLGDPNVDWEKRIDCLKKVRALIMAEATQYDEFMSELRSLEFPFQSVVKDLRSQVVREACITIAFLSQTLGMKFDHFAEAVLPPLINLIQNSAKIMATSGLVACNFIIKNTHAPKLIPLIMSSLHSKSREIRRASSELICQICHTWPTHSLERHVTALQEGIRHALSDADPDARLSARKAYLGFHSHFKDQADALFQSLDAPKQRQLRGEMSQSSSNNSIATGTLRASQENLRGGLPLQTYKGPGRSTSDIDTGAQRRARGGYMATLAAQAAARTTRTPGVTAVASHNMNSLPRSTTKTYRHISGGSSNVQQHPAAVTPVSSHIVNGSASRMTMRTPSKSISQPGSRSGSPTSRLPTPGSTARKYRPPNAGFASGLPVRSHGGSREQSPPRRRFSTEENGQTPPSVARYLTHDMDLGALMSHRRGTNPENMDMESETSSVCSERSFSTNPNRQMHLDNWGLGEALKNCLSTQWSERKDGLSYMLTMFKSKTPYTALELKRIYETFGRMFVDTHTKTFTLFLDTLVEFLNAYRDELHDWLYILLVRLLTKQSSDLLGSVQLKLSKTLDVLRVSFPEQLQFSTLVRYVSDPANTPSLKMKVCVLNYLQNLIHVMDSSHLRNSSDVRQAVMKISQWTSEAKSTDVRHGASHVLVALFGLNAGEFTAILGTFPKQSQDNVYRVLQSQLNKPASSLQTPGASRTRTSMSPGLTGGAHFDMDYVHDSLKRTSEEIQQYSFSGLQKVIGSQDSGIVDAVDSFQRADNDLNSTRLLMEQLGMHSDEDRLQEIITDILTELSNHNKRAAERRKAMSTLKYMTRDGTFTLWDEHFKSILLILVETLGDNDPEIRSAALRVLAEICLSQSPRFRDYAELTILRVVEAHKDEDKEVVRSAEECAAILAGHLPPSVCLRILIPILKNDEAKANLAAIKMITKAMEKMSPSEAELILPEITPLVIKAYEHPTQSVIRKASVVCLVAFNQLVGMEKLEPYLSELNNSKLKLLHLYIRRSETNSASPTSQF